MQTIYAIPGECSEVMTRCDMFNWSPLTSSLFIQVKSFFICLRRLGFCFVGGYPHRVTTSYPTLINWKVALLRFYLA